MKKKRYTMKIHMKRVKELLKKDKPCEGCPAGQGFEVDVEARRRNWTNDPCNVCAEFAGYQQGVVVHSCPCKILGKATNIAIARKKLTEYKSGRGGARKGAGRPFGSIKEQTRRRVSFRLQVWLADWLKKNPGSQSRAIERALIGFYNLNRKN